MDYPDRPLVLITRLCPPTLLQTDNNHSDWCWTSAFWVRSTDDDRMSTQLTKKSINLYRFGMAFELGRHEWIALRRLITNSRNSALSGGFRNRFLKETSQVNERTKNWIMKRLLHGTMRLRNSPTGEQLRNGWPTDEITRDTITPWCSPTLLWLSFSLAEISVLKIS